MKPFLLVAAVCAVVAGPVAYRTDAAPADPGYREVTIPAGTKIGVRLNSPVSSKGSRIEDPVDATIIAPVKIARADVVPAGSHVKGMVTLAEPSGRIKGRARLAMRFRTLTVGADSYPIAAQVSRIAPATKQKDAEEIGLPAAGGAIIGAIVGGKKGAAVGAAAGGGAGTAVVLATPGKEVALPRGSVIALRLQKAVTVRVPTKN
jgi:hypothetical protein